MSCALCECVNKVLQQPACTRLLGEEQEQGLLWKCFVPFQGITERSRRWETTSVWCGQSEGSDSPLLRDRGQGAEGEKMQRHHPGKRGVVGTSRCLSLESWNAVSATETRNCKGKSWMETDGNVLQSDLLVSEMDNTWSVGQRSSVNSCWISTSWTVFQPGMGSRSSF